MASKEHYDVCYALLTRFVTLVRDTGSLHGMSWSFSPRKVQIDDIINHTGIIIRKDKIYVQAKDLSPHDTLERVFSASVSFQKLCSAEYFCDKAMEDLIVEVFKAHHDYISDSLLVGYWEEI